jgi:hypothetical protein
MKYKDLYKELSDYGMSRDIIIYIDDEPYYVNSARDNGLNAVPMICDTCKYCNKDIPHTCDICTNLDEDNIGMWEERE